MHHLQPSLTISNWNQIEMEFLPRRHTKGSAVCLLDPFRLKQISILYRLDVQHTSVLEHADWHRFIQAVHSILEVIANQFSAECIPIGIKALVCAFQELLLLLGLEVVTNPVGKILVVFGQSQEHRRSIRGSVGQVPIS
jgi:hypothetical protein